jgi:hypothetical protein
LRFSSPGFGRTHILRGPVFGGWVTAPATNRTTKRRKKRRKTMRTAKTIIRAMMIMIMMTTEKMAKVTQFEDGRKRTN